MNNIHFQRFQSTGNYVLRLPASQSSRNCGFVFLFTDDRTDGRKDARANEQTTHNEGRTVGRTDEQSDRRDDGRTHHKTVGRTDDRLQRRTIRRIRHTVERTNRAKDWIYWLHKVVLDERARCASAVMVIQAKKLCLRACTNEFSFVSRGGPKQDTLVALWH